MKQMLDNRQRRRIRRKAKLQWKNTPPSYIPRLYVRKFMELMRGQTPTLVGILPPPPIGWMKGRT